MTKKDKAKSNNEEQTELNDINQTNADEAGIEDKKSVEEDKDSIINKLQNEIEQLNDKYLRLFSEFDNYRKRTLKEKIEHSKMASSEIITALLPIFDDLARACEISEENSIDESFSKGIALIYSKFKSILSQKGVKEISSLGEDFNTDYHEAVSNVEAESDDQKGKIVEEIEKGYLLHGKVLRYAKVVVAN